MEKKRSLFALPWKPATCHGQTCMPVIAEKPRWHFIPKIVRKKKKHALNHPCASPKTPRLSSVHVVFWALWLTKCLDSWCFAWAARNSPQLSLQLWRRCATFGICTHLPWSEFVYPLHRRQKEIHKIHFCARACQGIQGVCPQREAVAKVKVTRKWLPVGPVDVGWFDYSLEEAGWSRVVWNSNSFPVFCCCKLFLCSQRYHSFVGHPWPPPSSWGRPRNPATFRFFLQSNLWFGQISSCQSSNKPEDKFLVQDSLDSNQPFLKGFRSGGTILKKWSLAFCPLNDFLPSWNYCKTYVLWFHQNPVEKRFWSTWASRSRWKKKSKPSWRIKWGEKTRDVGTSQQRHNRNP